MISKKIIKSVSRITSRAFPNPADPAKLRFIGLVVDAVKAGRLCLEDFEHVANLHPRAAVDAIRGRIRGGALVTALGGRGRVAAAT